MNSTLHMHFDKPFEREIWMSRLGQTIGAVLSITQWSMVFFADAYVPHWTRSRLLRRRERAQPAHTRGRGGLVDARGVPTLEKRNLTVLYDAFFKHHKQGHKSGVVHG